MPDQPTNPGRPAVLDAVATGQGSCVVGSEDCMMSISRKHGFFWETVWKHPDNAELKRTRRAPRVLLSGDRVTIPEKEMGEELGGTEERHRFRRKGVPAKVRLRLQKDGAPRSDEPWWADIDGALKEGLTDDQGLVEITIPNEARSGWLRGGTGEDEEQFELHLGKLDPINSVSGVRMRLNNLGYSAGEEGDEWTRQAESAVREFQRMNGFEPTGVPDQQVLDQLLKVHGS